MRFPVLLEVDKKAQITNKRGCGHHKLLLLDRVHQTERYRMGGQAPLTGPLKEKTFSFRRLSSETRTLEPLHALKVTGCEARHNIVPRGAGTKN